MTDNLLVGVACGLVAGALWGLVFIAPGLTADFTAAQVSAARYIAYGAVALPLLLPRAPKLLATLTRRDWRALALLGLSGNVIYYICLATAVTLAGPAPTSLIIGLLPVLITIIGSRDEGAVPLRALWPSLLLAVGGVALISGHALVQGGTHGRWQDQALGLAAAAGALGCWAVYAVVNARAIGRLQDVSSQDWSLLLGVVTALECLVLAVPAFGLAPAHGDWTRFILVSTGIAVLASVIGNALWNVASRRLPLTMTAQLVVFETLFALIYSFAWEKRWPSGLEAAAIAMLVAGVWLCVSRHRVAKPAHE